MARGNNLELANAARGCDAQKARYGMSNEDTGVEEDNENGGFDTATQPFARRGKRPSSASRMRRRRTGRLETPPPSYD